MYLLAGWHSLADYDDGGGGGGGHYCTVLRLPVYRQCATVIVKPSLGEVLLSSVTREHQSCC